MAAFSSLPNEMLFVIISQLSFRDRARMALVSHKCRAIADDERSYENQYIRDFGNPASHDFYTGTKIVEEVSWKLAYERRHFADMPLLVLYRQFNQCGA